MTWTSSGSKLDALELPEAAQGGRPRTGPAQPHRSRDRWRPRSSGPTSRRSPSCRGTSGPRSTSTCAEAARILDEDHYALGDVKDRVLEFLAVRQLRDQGREGRDRRGDRRELSKSPAGRSRPRRPPCPRASGNLDDEGSKGPILLFVGPPGRRQDVGRQVHRPRDGPQVRPDLAGRRARRGGHPRATGAPTSARCPAGSSRE